jgi:hypothetical protein
MNPKPAHAVAAGRKVRLGRLPAQHRESNFKLARYLKKKALPAAPSSVHYGRTVTQLGGSFPMYGNDRLGDCTCAAVGHMVEVWTANGKGEVVTPTEDAIERLYIPETGSDDTGRYLNDVLDYWRKTGVDGGDTIHAYAEVNLKDQAEVEAATWLFGGLYIGLGLPVTAQQQKVWHIDRTAPAADQQPYSWGGHCVDTTGYATSQGVYCVTWGSILRMTWGFFRAYCDEAFAVISTDWLDSAGHSPKVAQALDLAALDADLAAL